ncbi:MAG: M36 family metallopeptidase, partial [Thermoanaerobaculia bacterium]
WMDMVWEMYWELVVKHGFDEDLYQGTGGNNLTIQLVIDGMKLQKCRPDMVEARDAILLADMNNNGGANQCEIWRGFAKRGLGVNADAGASGEGADVGDETEDFTVPAGCCSESFCLFLDGFESGDTTAWSNSSP